MIMKLEVMLRRNKFRDFYDIYSILKNTPIDIHDAMKEAVKHSNFALKTNNLIRILTNPERFKKDEEFNLLKPLYEVSSKEIADFIQSKLSSTNKTWIYGNPGRLFLKTIINGQEHMGKLLSQKDIIDYENQILTIDDLRLKYFKDELNSTEDIAKAKGVKL